MLLCALRRSSGCRAAKSAPNSASPISVITPGRAEGRPARLEGTPEHKPWIVHAAGVTPPAPERLRQPGLPVGCQKSAYGCDLAR
jgi:hypothetical protein